MAKSDRILPFNEAGNLPPGVYQVFLEGIEKDFTWTDKRKELYEGLVKAALNLASAGVLLLYIDGSFITNKEEPSDVDGCWVWHPGVDLNLLDDVFKERKSPREKMKAKFGVDFLIHGYDLGTNGQPIESWFQTDEDGNEKGILLLKL